MNDNVSKLISALRELRNASKQDPEAAMEKYDMIFLGENRSTIYTIELLHSLNSIFNIDITKDELLKLIPDVCNALEMKIEPFQVAGSSSRETEAYSIRLF